jgi:hypothetical protein
MKRQAPLRWALPAIVVATALALTICTYLIRNYPVPRSLALPARLLEYIQLPALALSAVVTGDYHDPAVVIRYALVFLTYVCLFWILLAMARWLRRHGRRGK